MKDKFGRTRTVAGAALVVLMAAGAVGLYGHEKESRAAETAAVSADVDVAEVVSASTSDLQPYSGRLEAVDKVDIRPLVGGTIVAIHFKDGAMVKKGAPLFDIDPRPYQAEVDRTAAQLAIARANEKYASIDAGRTSKLLDDNAIAKREYDQAQSVASAASASVLAAQAALTNARLNLMYSHIQAPVSGRMSRAELTAGNIVTAGPNAAVLSTVMSISPIYASFEVDEQTYLRYLAHGGKSAVPVTLGLANETGYTRKGVIDSIDNRLNNVSGTIRVRARFDNAEGDLLPGLYARVQVGGGAPHSTLLVDDGAIGTDQDKKFVMVIDGASHVQYREVKPGLLFQGRRVVLEGLKPGERIVVNGLQRVHPNDLVRSTLVTMPGGTKQG